MTHGRKAFLLASAASALVAVLVGLATNAASNTSRWPGPLDLLRTQPWWSLLVLAVAGLVLVVVTQPKSAAKTDEDLRGEAVALLDYVRREVSNELTDRVLNSPIMVPFAAHSADRGGSGRGDLETLVAMAGSATSRLAIVGGAGSGKSTALLYLVSRLVDEHTPGAPVPVPVNLAGWDPEREDIEDVIRRRITGRAKVRKRRRSKRFLRLRSSRWATPPVDLVSRNLVFPVFDGLDELPEHHWAKARRGLALYLDRGDRGFVLACWESVFLQIVPAEVLTRGNTAVVELMPVPPGSAEKYLLSVEGDEDGKKRWERLHAAMATDGSPQAEALSSPLMLYLTRKVFERPSTHPALLCQPRFTSKESIESFLLGEYIDAAYAPRERQDSLDRVSVDQYSPEEARRYLGWFARRLAAKHTTVLRWWEAIGGTSPQRLAGRWRWGRLAKLTAGYAVMGGVAAVVGGFVALGAVWLLTRVIMPWWVHDLGMRQTGAAFDPAVLTEPWIYTAADTLLGSPSVLRVAAAAVVAGALCVAVWQTLEAGPDEVDRAGSPRASFRADRGLMLVRVALVLAATTAVVVGLFGRAWRWGAAELGTALVNAGGITPETARSWNAVALGSDRFTAPVLAVSLAVAAFSTVIVSAWFGFQVGVLYRAARRQTPRAVFDFLDDAHRRGVLRREGAVYEFRHRLVHHYLADPSTAARPVEDVLREARALAGSGKRRRAAALLSTITTVTSEAYVRLAELHEDWSYRFRDPVRQFWYWKHFDLSVRYWKLAIDNGYPEAVELAAAMYSRQLRRCGRSLIGSFYKMTLHDRAREFWAGEAEFANPATRAALLEIMEDHLRDRERFAWLRMQQATLRRRVNKVRDLPDGAPVRDRNWWASVVLGDTAERALRSASIGAQGGALQTGAVFAALARVDAHNSSAWADFWLHTNYPDPADLERVKDTSAESSLPPLPIGRSGYSLIPSVDLRAALERLAELVVTERLDHVPPGVLALALTSVPEAGATRLLCAMGRTDADMLRQLVRQHLC